MLNALLKKRNLFCERQMDLSFPEARYDDPNNINIQDIKDDFLRILSLENTKLTEKLVKNEKLQTHRIENIISEQSHLLQLLNDQKRQNQVILEENNVLREQLKQNLSGTTNLKYNARTSHKSERQTFANSDSGCHDRHRDKEFQFSYQRQEAFSMDNKRSMSNIEASTESDSIHLKNMALLKNHIFLLEQENDILRKNLVLSKQHEIRLSLEQREQQLQLQSLQTRIDQVTRENFDLKQSLSSKEEEMTNTITRLTDINKHLVSKVKEYESAVDILTKELYKYTEAQAQKGAHSKNQLSFMRQDFAEIEPPERKSIARRLFQNDPSNEIQEGLATSQRPEEPGKQFSKSRSLSELAKKNTNNQTDVVGTKVQSKNPSGTKPQPKSTQKTPMKPAARKTVGSKQSDRGPIISARDSGVLQKNDQSSERYVGMHVSNA